MRRPLVDRAEVTQAVTGLLLADVDLVMLTGLKVLATSRGPLRIRGEVIFSDRNFRGDMP